jgi:hypothetical protein
MKAAHSPDTLVRTHQNTRCWNPPEHSNIILVVVSGNTYLIEIYCHSRFNKNSAKYLAPSVVQNKKKMVTPKISGKSRKDSTFRGPCIVKYSYNKSQRDALFHKFILVKNSTCFGQIYCPSSGVLILYSQQLVFGILKFLKWVKLLVYIYVCMYTVIKL